MTLFCCLVLAACSGGETSITDPSSSNDSEPAISHVVVSPSEQELTLGDTAQFEAVIYAEDGSTLDGEVTWNVQNPEVASIDSGGMVIGHGEGRTDVLATVSTAEGRSDVQVKNANRVVNVDVQSDSLRLNVGDTTQVSADLLNEQGETASGTPKWSSHDTDVATVDETGTVIARTEGATYIVARSAGVRDSLDLTVATSDSDGDSGGSDGSGGSSDDGSADSPPEMPASVSVSQTAKSSSDVTYDASWSEASGAETYGWEAGSNSARWSLSGDGLTSLSVTFQAPRDSADDESYFCVTASNSAGSSEPRCDSFTVPGTGTDADDSSTSQDTVAASVTVTPSSAEVEVGNTVLLSATVENSSGETLDRDVSWGSLDEAVASVDNGGTVTGEFAGTTGIVASVDGVADTSSVEVIESTSGSAAPAVVFDPDNYSSTQELEDDPYGVFYRAELGGNYGLDTDVGYPGGTRSMKYEWVDQGCASVAIGRTIPIPGVGTSTDMNESVQEVWIEMYVRWSSNFQQNVDPDCAADLPAHKLLFVSNRLTSDDTPSNHGRWALTWNGGGGSITLETPQERTGDWPGGLTGINGHEYFDGEWHKVRLHLRQDPGLYWLEVDGEVLVERTGFTVDPSDNKMWNVLVGRNKDEGNPSGTESLWWGKLSVWTSNPGW